MPDNQTEKAEADVRLLHEARDCIRGTASVVRARLEDYFLGLILRRIVLNWFTNRSLAVVGNAVKAVQEHRAKKEEKHGKDDVVYYDFTGKPDTGRKRVPGR